ncbi:ubiquitin ligase complex subunit HRD3 ASCRUDRAFT_73468 [Ascoidea rubescens DSM 1968]|uniref:HCP-like protein n=1 Tax=Ascoidea rubescens DSM 1968 TaxID=1344418 RepID=A0A1D2VPY3_9ASCO|nr:hypothetical protein ASCRUDRAFT_73468 [Ascoidea rubescens DSM 1968]ODV63659.1 hypothetical protein ASCRUDRAFT_73468 [Ascoidea rubescens DSM 1968]
MEYLNSIPQQSLSNLKKRNLIRYEQVEDIKLLIPDDYYITKKQENIQKGLNLSTQHKSALQLLNYGAVLNNLDCIFTLAEINFYGNYSYPINATQSLFYYKKLSQLDSNATAYYMLGYIYSTGLFGEIPINQAKANLYFNVAGVELNDLKSLMILGYRYFTGISVERNCNLALYYYSLASKIAYRKYVLPFIPYGGLNLDSYSIRIGDFNNFDISSKSSADLSSDLSSNGISELPNSINRRISNYYNKNLLNEFKFDPNKHRHIHYYYSAKSAYEGDYLNPKNFTDAFRFAHRCAVEGIKKNPELFNINKSKKIDPNSEILEAYFLGKCISLVGHMYLRGESVPQDFTKALKWLNKSKEVPDIFETFNDLGLIYEFALGLDKPDLHTAIEYYKLASEKHQGASYNLGRVYLKLYNKKLDTQNHDQTIIISKQDDEIDEPTIFELTRKASYSGKVEAIYQLGQLYESGFNNKESVEDNVMIYKTFLEKLEPFVTSLEWSFNQLLVGHYDLALLGYSMAAEQGLETAQASAAYLLFRFPSKLKKFPKIDSNRVLAAINYLTKSSRQFNIDSTVLLGDMYYYDLLNLNYTTEQTDSSEIDNSAKENYKKAAACYQVASNKQSSQANWNLGYMYENGIGLSRDYHLAKRYYDSALVGHPKVNIPVQLSLLRLSIKSYLKSLFGRNPGEEFAYLNEKDYETKRTWRDWVNLIYRTRGVESPRHTNDANDGAQTANPTLNNDNGNPTSDSFNVFLNNDNTDEDELEDYENLIVFGFVVIVFAIAYLLHYISQRRIRREAERRQNHNNNNENNNDNRPIPPPFVRPQPNFQFHFMVLPL